MISPTRFCLVSLVVSFALSGAVLCQDASQQAMQAAQQANQDAMQANQDAMQAAQQANQDMMQASATASQNNCCQQASKPSFSKKTGKYRSVVTVRMKDKTRFANIYYTTDGWTPTEYSTLYTGPITVASTTLLQAIAIAPNHDWSGISSALYTIDGQPFDPCNSQNVLPSANGSAQSAQLSSANDHETAVPLVFTSQISSANAEIGDKVSLTVARDVTVNGTVLAGKGTPVVATVTQVNPAGLNAKPGVITFQVKSLDVNGKTLPLRGIDSKQAPGVNRAPFYALMFVPFAGPFIGASSVLVHGKNAVIEPGTCVTAFLDSSAPGTQEKSSAATVSSLP